MAHTQITLSNDNGVLMPSQSSVPVVQGDSVAFSASDGTAVMLFFSPDAGAILSPAPSGPAAVPVGGSTTFTFTSSAQGAYSVFFGLNASGAPDSFSTAVSSQLKLGIDINEIEFDVAPPRGPRTG